MSINLSVGFMIPTNVVEVGNEITSDQLAAITNASNAPTAYNPFATNAFVTGQGYITTSYTYDTKKAIANLCASCMYLSTGYVCFDGAVAISVASGPKFTGTMYSQYLLGYTMGSSNVPFTLSASTNGIGDTIALTGVGYLTLVGERLVYSEDSGSTWTQSDFTFGT